MLSLFFFKEEVKVDEEDFDNNIFELIKNQLDL